MKVVILAGGLGTRLSEETSIKPKPMVEIGGKPIIWHIMKAYSHYGFDDFIILLGYKGYVIKEYFSNYFLHQSDVTIDLSNNSIKTHENKSESWKVTMLDTGVNSMTGGRIKRAKEYIGNEDFLLTYGDGLADVNIQELVRFHKQHGKKVTITAIQPAGRYGALELKENKMVSSFKEKPKGDGSWVNGGFFICNPSVIDYIEDDTTVFEEGPLSQAITDGEVFALKHHGFWKCMDTLRDRMEFEQLWSDKAPPWKVWQ